jgi:hypothetical protein
MNIDIDVEVVGLNHEDLSLDYLSPLIRDPSELDDIYCGVSYIPEHSSLDDFLNHIRELMDIEQEDRTSKVILVDDFSKINIFEDPRNPKADVLGVVTCCVESSKPGSFSQTNNPMNNSGTREIRPSLRGIEKRDIEDQSTYKYYFGQRFDNQISFKIHARSNKEANQIVSWFQNLLQVHKKFFAQKGIIRYYFLERESDTVAKEADSVIHIRPLCYYLTTEESYTITENVLQKLKLKLKTT